MSAALALDEYSSRPLRAPYPSPANDPDRQEPSSVIRRKPSLYLVSGNPNRLTTNTYAGQGCPNAAGARCAGAADPEDRLTEDRLTAGSGTTNTLSYDLNGNRTQLNTTAYLYAASSNRLTQIGTKVQTLDPAGNTTTDNLNFNYVYYATGTLKEARAGTKLKGTYTYNHRFQRTRKVAGSTTTVYHYDLEGNLLAETKNTGVLIRAYVHDDQTPIAQVTRTTTDTLAYLHTDALNTPRLATNTARSIVWRHDGNAFGDSAITGSITVNLRFPGQYYDAETKLHYNWNRYYDPRIGRYITSDPIGLEGGLNTYAYVDSNPLIFSDPEGLDAIVVRNSTATYYGPKNEVMLSIPIVSGLPKVRDPKEVGRGPTPPGVYTIEQLPAAQKDKLFCVGKECWYVPYVPQFTTPNKRCLPEPLGGTGTCGIHPANYGQTAGCTGIPSAKDAAKMRELIRKFKPSPKNPLPVLVGK